jgi:hypothetical protein
MNARVWQNRIEINRWFERIPRDRSVCACMLLIVYLPADYFYYKNSG